MSKYILISNFYGDQKMSLINNAFADEATKLATGPNAAIMQLFPFVIIFFIFYFMLIRPQMKKQKEHVKMLESLKKGEKVVTSGGIVGTITKVDDNLFHLEVANDMVIKVIKSAVTEIFNPKTAVDTKK
jgi:preprotein translocase subunit YajC